MSDRTTVVVRYAHRHKDTLSRFDEGPPHSVEVHDFYIEGRWNEVDPHFFISDLLPMKVPVEGFAMSATGIEPFVFAIEGRDYEECPSDANGVPVVRYEVDELVASDVEAVENFWSIWKRVRASFKEEVGG
jgi:hypothetical protein